MKSQKISIRLDVKSPDQKANDKQLQTANLVYIFDKIILGVTASKYGIMTEENYFTFLPDMGRITLESNALNYHYLPKMCIELPLPLLNFVKVMH